MCGVFGIYGHPEAANITYLGLHALQHRGQEAAGIVTSDGERLTPHRSMGLVQAGFSPTDLAALRGDRAIGHVRYSTAGGSHIRNAQPFAVDYARGSVAVGHNGNLTNYEALRDRLEARGSIFQSASDTEVIVHLIAASTQATVESRVAEALGQVEGAYSILFLTERELIAVRDPMGFRPLCMGRLSHGGVDAVVIASEPTAFDLIGATYVRDIEPGEMVIVDANGTRSLRPFAPRTRKLCIFEHVYFARPDSLIEGASVYEVRKALGRKLAEESPVPGGNAAEDVVVVPVPDSGVPAAVGFAERASAPFEMGLIRSHYVGRTFIEPQQSIRHFGVRLKLSPNRAALANKRVVVVDDSIVRGTTSRKIVKMVRDAGAREVHLRISSPPTRWPCFYGIDTPTRAELIAATHTLDEICKYVTADSLGYLSLEGLVTSVSNIERGASPDGPPATSSGEAAENGYCAACFSGTYPVPFNPNPKSRHLRLVHG
ncbi:amidophosphoribosyltransferase [Polyangium sp. 15x6]|uniref:amidophosphoribosyltransferase n=1 Tax=Polyangium sp. 15x6 TaxID=3042687 RepID=UPI00249A385B|nr:amidophosphoribosyltransferase [Polyangium sp. 15x6]MDI3289086.1 amidophosphoribosyltransferase [Polyangium sp. 15x6]